MSSSHLDRVVLGATKHQGGIIMEGIAMLDQVLCTLIEWYNSDQGHFLSINCVM
jgi:hypothetical protein